MTAHQVDSRWISHEAMGVSVAFLSRPRQRPEAGVLVLHEAFGLNAESGWFRLSIGAVSMENIAELFPRLRKLLNEVE